MVLSSQKAIFKFLLKSTFCDVCDKIDDFNHISAPHDNISLSNHFFYDFVCVQDNNLWILIQVESYLWYIFSAESLQLARQDKNLEVQYSQKV